MKKAIKLSILIYIFTFVFTILSFAQNQPNIQFEKISSNLSPEAIQQLKQNPSFQGLSPQEIQKGLEILNKGNTQTSSPQQGNQNNKKETETTNASNSSSKTTDSNSDDSLFGFYLKNRKGELKVSLKIEPFGYNIFKNNLSKPLTFQPVPPNYIIGPGDEIQVLMWGRINTQYTLKVGSDGRIFFPNIGPLMVAGMTYSKMQKFLTDQAKRIIGTNVSISLYKLHQIQVFVLGEVKKPGIYNIPAMSTVLNALIAAGGPTIRGSLRNIQVKRNNRVIDKLDIYEMLIKGDDSKNIILKNNDVIFVPLVGPLVGVAGYVKRPAIYELKNEKSLYEVIKLAGGFLPSAWDEMVQIKRLQNHEWEVALDVKAANKLALKQFTVKDGDLIKVFPIISSIVNSVALNGNVLRPGTYAYKAGMKLTDLIKSKGDLLPNTYLKYGLIKRYNLKNLDYRLIPFNLESVLEGKTNIELKPLDTIYVFPKEFFMEEPVYYIYGEVQKPGIYRTWDKNFRLKDLIMRAGGLKNDAYLNKVEVVSYKVNKDGNLVKIADKYYNLKLALKGDPVNNILLKPYDKVIVRKIPGWGDEITVAIKGEVKFPGTYILKKGSRLSDLIEKAGGYKDDAYLKGATLTMPSAQKIQQEALNSLINRLKSEIFLSSNASTSSAVSTEEIQTTKLQMSSAERFINSLKQLKAKGRVVVSLAPVRILRGSPYDLQLEDGSNLYIPQKKNIINVVGAVMYPSSFIYSKDLTYKDYVKMAGGYTEYADEDNVFIIAANGSAYKVSGGFVRWNPFKSRWEVSSFSDKNHLEPGDTIVVPAKLTYVPWLRNVKDITQVMMQIAVTAGVVLKLF